MEKYVGKQFFKITNINENHHGFQYQDGLNILTESFNDNPQDSCVAGGFYITTVQYINNFYGYGVNLREVILPLDDSEFKIVEDPCGDKWRVNKLILGNKYSLYDPKTYELFFLNMQENHDIIIHACANGNIEFLEWWIENNDIEVCNDILDNLNPCAYPLDIVSRHGNVDILQWWRTSELKFKYCQNAIDWASSNGHINVLQWWQESGFELKYSDYAMNWASENGHLDVLQWWVDSGLKIKYSAYAIDFASDRGYIKVLDWWKKSDLKLEYTERAIDYASQCRHIMILDWWKRSGLESKYTKYAIDVACNENYVDVIKWWINSGLELKYSTCFTDIIQDASQNL
jgi:ankyrin repeat protein